jgi:hypothetical protein
MQGVRLDKAFRTLSIIKGPSLVLKQRLSKALELNIILDSSDRFPN